MNLAATRNDLASLLVFMGRIAWASLLVLLGWCELRFSPRDGSIDGAVVVALLAAGWVFHRDIGERLPIVRQSQGHAPDPGATLRKSTIFQGGQLGRPEDAGEPQQADPPVVRRSVTGSPHPRDHVAVGTDLAQRGLDRQAVAVTAATATISRPDPTPAPRRPSELTVIADFPQPPRFGPGSKNHGKSWILPRTPAQSGIAADEARLGDVDLRAASVVGPSHRCAEPATPRQDAYRISRDASGQYLLIALADGVSASSRSDLGAAVAVETAVNLLRRRIDNGAPPSRVNAGQMFTEIAQNMADRATELRLSTNDMQSVLVTAVVPTYPERGGNRVVWVSWIGDVSVWALSVGGRWEQLAGDRKPGDGEVYSNDVHAVLPRHPAAVETCAITLSPGSALALVSDGIGDAMQQGGANAYFSERWAAPPSVVSFLNDVCYDAHSRLDDRTAVVLWTPPPAGFAGGPGR